MILVIDNYDSFTYNVVQELGELGADLTVYRNDKITVDEIRELAPERIVISPGPGFPVDAGVSLNVIRELGAEMPLLGICLGHQAIGEAYGGLVVHAPELMHGKTSMIYHDGDTIMADIPNPFEATRYHSLIVQGGVAARLPDDHGADGDWRNHGPAAQNASGNRRAVSPGEHLDLPWHADAGQLHEISANRNDCKLKRGQKLKWILNRRLTL